MGVKVAVRARIVVNSKEYHSVEEMPPEIREKYEKAIGSRVLPGQPRSTIIFNGQPYDSPEAMPPDERRLYEAALAALPASSGLGTASSVPAAEKEGDAIEPSSAPRWTLVVLFLGVGLLILWYFLRARG